MTARGRRISKAFIALRFEEERQLLCQTLKTMRVVPLPFGQSLSVSAIHPPPTTRSPS